MRGLPAFTVAAALGALLPAACGEARPDLALRVSANDPPGLATTVNECGACHIAYPPEFLPARSWRALMSQLSNHFGEDASLDAATVQRITDFLVSRSADSPYGNSRLMAGLAPTDVPQRITDMPFWRRLHRNHLQPGVGSGDGLRSAANCRSCHNGGGDGSTDD
jgi:hypothetical protein